MKPARAAALLLFVLTACSGWATRYGGLPAASQSGDDGPAGHQRVVVTRDSDRGPSSCGPGAVGELLVDFLYAINSGKEPIEDYFVSDMQWFSVTTGNPRAGGSHIVAYNKRELRRYFAERAELHEHWRLIAVDVDYERRRNLGHLSYVIERRADDLKRFERRAHGKGAIDCTTGKIVAWSMGVPKGVQEGPSTPGLPCPQPRRSGSDIAVACTRT
jgi:hypothetical protein